MIATPVRIAATAAPIFISAGEMLLSRDSWHGSEKLSIVARCIARRRRCVAEMASGAGQTGYEENETNCRGCPT
jgi:hypothetical protein